MQSAVTIDGFITSVELTFVEVHSALARAFAAGRLPNLEAALDQFRLFWRDVIVVGADTTLIRSGADLAGRHRLRGYDALQLAAALSAEAGSDLPFRFAAFDLPFRFAAFDLGLRRAAAVEGLSLL